MDLSKIEVRFTTNGPRLILLVKNGKETLRRTIKGFNGYDLSKWNSRRQRFEETGPDTAYFNAILQEIADSCNSILEKRNPSSCAEFCAYFEAINKKTVTHAIVKNQSLRAAMLGDKKQETTALSLKDFKDDQLIEELRRRGFSGKLCFLKTVEI